MGCGLQIPNEEVCIELPTNGAFCTYTQKDEDRKVGPDEWDKESVGRFSMTAEAFGEYQKFITEACIRYKCSAKEAKNRERLLQIMDRVGKAGL